MRVWLLLALLSRLLYWPLTIQPGVATGMALGHHLEAAECTLLFLVYFGYHAPLHAALALLPTQSAGLTYLVALTAP